MQQAADSTVQLLQNDGSSLFCTSQVFTVGTLVFVDDVNAHHENGLDMVGVIGQLWVVLLILAPNVIRALMRVLLQCLLFTQARARIDHCIVEVASTVERCLYMGRTSSFLLTSTGKDPQCPSQPRPQIVRTSTSQRKLILTFTYVHSSENDMAYICLGVSRWVCSNCLMLSPRVVRLRSKTLCLIWSAITLREWVLANVAVVESHVFSTVISPWTRRRHDERAAIRRPLSPSWHARTSATVVCRLNLRSFKMPKLQET